MIRLTRYGVSEIKTPNCGCNFRGFHLELDTLDTKNFGIGSVGTKLQLLEVTKKQLPSGQLLGGGNFAAI